MKNFWLRRRNMPKIGDLVNWVDCGVIGAHAYLLATYGQGPFRITDRKFEFDEDTFYYMLATIKQVPLKDWFASNMLTKYNWGVDFSD